MRPSAAAGGHAGAADEVAGDGEGDGGVVFFEVAVEEGEVGLGDLALGEHLAEFAVGAVVFGDEDEAAGLLVEAMDDAGAEVAADVGEFVEVEEERVDEGAVVAGRPLPECEVPAPAWTIMPAGLLMTARCWSS